SLVFQTECNLLEGVYRLEFTTDVAVEVEATHDFVQINNTTFQLDNIPLGEEVELTLFAFESACILTTSVESPECTCPFIVPPMSFGDVSVCSGEALAALQIEVLDNQTAAWYASATSNELLSTATNFLPNVAGTYYAEAIDVGTGCASNRIAVSSNVLERPVFELSSDGINCFGDTNASIEVLIANNENMPFSYAWSTGSTAVARLANVGAGTYELTLTDSNACSDTRSIELNAPEPLEVNIETNNALCNESNGRISVRVEGGNAPYLFAWSNEASTPILDNIPEGTYGLTVTDALNCTFVATATVNCEILCNAVAGALPTTLIQSCASESLVLEYDATNEILGEGDLRQLVLHNGSATALGTSILQSNTEATFSFSSPRMQTDVTYYITVIVGADDGTGNVDLSDECLAISNGTPIQFTAVPSPIIELQATNRSICVGDALRLMAAIEGVADSFLWETPQGFLTTSDASLDIPFFTLENAGDYLVSYSRAGCESPQFGPLDITLDSSIEQMTAGIPQVLCGENSTSLAATLPPDAVGHWVTTSSATIENPDQPNATVSGLQAGVHNIFYWQVYTAACSALDTTTIYYVPSPILEDQQFEMAANSTALLLNKDFLLEGDAKDLPVEMLDFEILTLPNFGTVRDTTGGLLYERAFDQLQDETVEFSYEVCVTDTLCGQVCARAKVEILVRFAESETISYRSALRPNGNNPLWSIQVLQNLSEASVKIVDRWGQIVHVRQLNDGTNLQRGSTISDAWDGKNQAGELLPQGAYYFLFTGVTDESLEVEPVNGVIYLMD
ncbi:MAG: gliding motility-associated C-terminal domain-containing protein, partial [Bacteroidota bacterium]